MELGVNSDKLIIKRVNSERYLATLFMLTALSSSSDTFMMDFALPAAE